MDVLKKTNNVSPVIDRFIDNQEDVDLLDLTDFFDDRVYNNEDDVRISESTNKELDDILAGPFLKLDDPIFQGIEIPGDNDYEMHNEKMSHLVLLLFTEQGYLPEGKYPYTAFASPEGNNRSINDSQVITLIKAVKYEKKTALQMYTENYSVFPFQVYREDENEIDEENDDNSDYYRLLSVLDRQSDRYIRGKRWGPLSSEKISEEYKGVSNLFDCFCSNQLI